MHPEQVILRVRLDAETKEELSAVGRRRGMTQSVLVTRLVSWFSRQEPAIQSAIVGGMNDEVAGTLIKLWARRSTTLEKAAGRARPS